MDVFFLFYFRLLLLDWQLQRRAPSAVLHLKVIGHSVCCVLPYFLKEHILSAKDNTRQLHRDNCLYLIFIFFAINAFHQHFFFFFVLVSLLSRRKGRNPRHFHKTVGAAAQQLPLWNARWYRRGSSTDEALHIFSFLFLVSFLEVISGSIRNWSETPSNKERLCSLLDYRPSGILLKTIYIWCMCVCICFAYATKSQKIKRRHLIVKKKKSNILRPNLFRDPHFCYFFFFSKISPATLYFKRPIFIQFFQ